MFNTFLLLTSLHTFDLAADVSSEGIGGQLKFSPLESNGAPTSKTDVFQVVKSRALIQVLNSWLELHLAPDSSAVVFM